MRKIHGLLITLLFLVYTSAHSDNASIVSANNQASISVLMQHQNTSYSNNDDGYPLWPLHGNLYGGYLSISKTFSHLYTEIDLGATNGTLNYNHPGIGPSQATQYVQQLNGRLGYTFYPATTIGLTPYLTAGYQHRQLDTNGIPRFGTRMDGFTQITQFFQYGAGLMGQWAATQAWVLAADMAVLTAEQPWTYATLPFLNRLTYQQVNLSSPLSWQVGLSSDYKMTSKLHALLNVKYTSQELGAGQSTNYSLNFPAQQNHIWQYTAGLGYELDGITSGLSATDHRAALVAANNEASLSVGSLYQNYGEILPGRPGYLDRQTGQMPQVKMAFSKTWKNIYGQLALSEALGYTEYNGSTIFTNQEVSFTIRNTMTDVIGRLGYQLIWRSVSLTPYGIAGYHRWLRSMSNPETYHHTWTGLGGMLQWAPLSNLVLSLDGNTGQTSHAQLATWNTFFPPNTVKANFNLGSRTYVMASVGGDLAFSKKWHVLANATYWRFNYQASTPNQFRVLEPTSNTRLVGVLVGLGYGLGT